MVEGDLKERTFAGAVHAEAVDTENPVRIKMKVLALASSRMSKLSGRVENARLRGNLSFAKKCVLWLANIIFRRPIASGSFLILRPPKYPRN
ncbi:MAG: hypothetical protein DMG57_43560 [Acidobacteria bacterium]|nr:MAG: hypothetical protein DMG57_43560 [Acidobacteriota bacterium]